MSIIVSNGTEWLIKPESTELMRFESVEEAVQYLLNSDFREDQVYNFRYYKEETCQEKDSHGNVPQLRGNVAAAELTASVMKFFNRVLLKILPTISVLWRANVL